MKEEQADRMTNNRLMRRLRRQHYLTNQLQSAMPDPAGPAEPQPEAQSPHAHPHAHHAHKHPALADAEKAIENLRDQLVRNQAEFENFRKRQRRENQQRLDLANQALIEQILPVLDNFRRAIANPGDTVEGLLPGIQMIAQQLDDTLRQNGLEKIDALGKPFDPNHHEAVSVEITDTVPDGQVVEAFQDGYMLRGRLIRPAMVKVARHP